MLTPAQKQALDLTTHTAIIANAGSGKTKVLVEKYLSILLANADYHPRDLIAITFTEQAARDLKRKILDEIERRLSIETTAADIRRRLNEIRFLLGSAQISTIHAFCNQLLRTYPVEANVDASFGILFPPEDRILLDEAIRAVFYRILEAAYKDETGSEAQFLPLFRTLGRKVASEAMHSMMSRRSTSVDIIKLVSKINNAEMLAAWNAAIQDFIEKRFLAEIDPEWYGKCLTEHPHSSKKSQKARAALSTFLAAKGLKEKATHAIALLNEFHTKEWSKLANGIVDKMFEDAIEHEIAPRLERLNRIKSVVDSYIDPSMTADFESSYLSLTRSLVELFEHVLEEYESTKIAHGLIDHDDSLLKTLALVEVPEIAAELAAKYRHILVDEYQDTDPVQYRIIDRITSHLQAGNTLTIVGDPKQSIYSFRNAELPLFFETVGSIQSSSRNSFVELQENFRILPAPLAVINTLFEHIFNDRALPDSPKHLPLIQARPAKDDGKVEILISDEQLGDERLSESEIIARKINELLASGYVIEDKQTLRPVEYRDIAILQRSRGRQKAIERALYAHQIPFSIYSGTGFYSRQEIIDILTYLQFLLDPTDDVALAGTLRSPFFTFEDRDLLKIAVERTPSDNTFWDIVARVCRSSDVPLHWQRAYTQLSENSALVGRIAAYQLINKIYEETRVFGIYEQLQFGRQAIANLEKFAAMALAGESSPFFGTYDFVERILLLADRDDQEAQADLRDDEDTVRIMTIHAAKGLEFPIVILPQLERDLTKKDSRQIDVLLDQSLGAVLTVRDSAIQHWVYKLARHEQRERELDEEKRIFYVAATRARDYLILSASLEDRKTPANSYLRWIEQALDIDLRDLSIETIHKVAPIKVYEDEKITGREVSLVIPVIRSLPSIESGRNQRSDDKFILEGNLASIPESESQSRYSPTQLLHYIECPTKYYLRYGLGLPEESYLSIDSEAADLAEFIKGTLLGQLVHYALEKVDSFNLNESIDIEKFDAVLREALEHLEIYDPAAFTKYKEPVQAHLLRFITSDYGGEILKADGYKELNLRTMLNKRQMLSGVIDRLYKTDDGNWEILDYKTDRTPVNKKKLDRYRFQMKFYAYLVSRFSEMPVESITANLFFTAFGAREHFTFTQRDLETVGKELNNTVARIRKDQEADSLAKISRHYDHCPECQYYNEADSGCIADGKLKRTQLKLRQDSLFHIEL
jgi:ATP-dependent helicase/nuclease subunit A